jgi:tRNA 2-selenouridine synthase
VIVLDGNTGTAKTEVLGMLPSLGLQVIDLEGLARHRGSLFGGRPGGQPTQRFFEGRLAHAFAALDPSRPVIVEAESALVGDLALPGPLWAAMRAAPRIRITAPHAARAAYLARAYADVAEDPTQLAATIGKLRPYHSRDVIDSWLARAAAGRIEDLAADLTARHYDPRYEKHRARMAPVREVEVRAERLDADALPALARDVAAAVASLGGTAKGALLMA